jgi:HK97 family phage portal protein
MIFNRLLNPGSEDRAISFQTIFESGNDIAIGNFSGTRIDSETVFQVNAVFSAVSLIADTISTLPLHAYVRDGDRRVELEPRPAWLDRPDADMPAEAFWNSVVVSMLLNGNAYIRVFYGASGQPATLTVLNPTQVEVKRTSVGRLQFTVEGDDRPLTTDEIIFIPDLVSPGKIKGVSRVEALKESFGLALALERFASTFFGQGTNLSGIIEFPGNLSQEQADNVRAGFDNRHKGWKRGHRTGILTGGATFKPTQSDPQQSQAIEARRMAVEDIARAFNVPPHLLGLPGTNSYASVEQNNLAWVTHGLRPILTKIEGAFNKLLNVSPNGEHAHLKFNLDGLLRADIQSRFSAYSTALQGGFMTINEARALEDLPPQEDNSANIVRVPLANVDVDDSRLRAARERVTMARDLVYAGYDPAGVLSAVGLDAIDHTGLPSSQLQQIAAIDPEDPQSAYPVEGDE